MTQFKSPVLPAQVYKNIFKNLAYGSFTQVNTNGKKQSYLVSHNAPVRLFLLKQHIESRISVYTGRVDSQNAALKKLKQTDQFAEMSVIQESLSKTKNVLRQLEFVKEQVVLYTKDVMKALDNCQMQVYNQDTLISFLEMFEYETVPQIFDSIERVQQLLKDIEKD